MIKVNPAYCLDPSEIVEGMAEIFWGDGWATHAEEHRCANISGEEITEIMPQIPARIYAFCERVMGKIEQANGTNEFALLYAALTADGKNPSELFEKNRDEFDRLANEFGNGLAYMAMGSGVSWFDDHEKFDLEVPHCENEAYIIAEELCDDVQPTEIAEDDI